MLQQEAMIERTRRVCRKDERLAEDRRFAETFSASGLEDS
jgi:hypothetical protein